MKIGDKVRLNKKAVRFYTSEERIEDYMAMGDFNLQNIQMLFSNYLGFENGENAGTIVGSSEYHCYKIEFTCPITLEKCFSFYGEDELELCK